MQRRTLGYVRVSSNEQALRGDSLDALRCSLENFAIATGRSLHDVIVDAGEGAKDLRRPGLSRLLGDVNDNRVDAVLIAKLDRLTRSVKDLADLVSLFETTSGRYRKQFREPRHDNPGWSSDVKPSCER